MLGWNLIAAVALENLEDGVGCEADGVDGDALIGGIDEVQEGISRGSRMGRNP
jgi:hypothetical protein